MKIIISPAKKMNHREDELNYRALPCFLSRTRRLMDYIKSLSFSLARELWQCNEKIAALNYERFCGMDLETRLTPALLSYEGIQYQYMSPGVFEQSQWEYVQEHLRILSGFYGVLRPLDGVVPYRLEMQAKIGLPTGEKSLYQFWGDSIYRELSRGEDVIVNLASKEYAKAVEPWLEPGVSYVTCVFGAMEKEGRGKAGIKVKATQAKMARGEMVRFMAEGQVENIEGLKAFDRLGYTYEDAYSDHNTLVFLKNTDAGRMSQDNQDEDKNGGF